MRFFAERLSPPSPSPQSSGVSKVESEIASLKSQEKLLDDVSEFVAKSLVRRNIIKKEKELATLPGGGSSAPPAPWAHAAGLAGTYSPPVVMVVAYCALALGGTPALALPPRLLWPLDWAVTGRDGSVGALVFLTAAQAVVTWLAPALLEATGLVPAKPPLTLFDQILGMTGLSGFKAFLPSK